jgi:hypothetical protein
MMLHVEVLGKPLQQEARHTKVEKEKGAKTNKEVWHMVGASNKRRAYAVYTHLPNGFAICLAPLLQD